MGQQKFRWEARPHPLGGQHEGGARLTIINWIELLCSECGRESFGGPRFREHYNAVTLRAEARKSGWIVERQDGLNFDVCPSCQGKKRLTD